MNVVMKFKRMKRNVETRNVQAVMIMNVVNRVLIMVEVMRMNVVTRVVMMITVVSPRMY